MTEYLFTPRAQPQLSALLERILDRAQTDLPEAIGLVVTVNDKRYGDKPTVVAARGVGGELVGAQLAGLGGPVVDAMFYQVPVISLDLWGDDRWPRLTREALDSRAPEHAWQQVRGAAAVPGVWEADATIVISCALDRPATAVTVTALIGYEQLVSAAFVTTAAQDAAGIQDMLAVLQSRGAIEQAKGAVMGKLRCDAEYAWNTLRRASQESNVQLRGLAVALLEHISGSPAEQPPFSPPITPDTRTRETAERMWEALSGASNGQVAQR
jgi:hypothetical protein